MPFSIYSSVLHTFSSSVLLNSFYFIGIINRPVFKITFDIKNSMFNQCCRYNTRCTHIFITHMVIGIQSNGTNRNASGRFVDVFFQSSQSKKWHSSLENVLKIKFIHVKMLKMKFTKIHRYSSVLWTLTGILKN